MAATRPKLRTEPFIHQAPNKSRYAPRLSPEEWLDLKLTITDRLDRGISIADILRQLRADGFQITRSQLDTQMKKWSASTITNEPHQDAMSCSQDTPIPNVWPLESTSDDSNVESSSSAQTAQNRKSDEDFEAHKSTTMENTTNEPRAAHVTPQVSEYHPKILSDRPVVWFPFYHISNTIRHLNQPLPVESGDWGKRISRLSYLAALLLNLKCFSEAFEVFYLILCDLNSATFSDETSITRLIFSITGCIRCASSEQQTLVARVLDKQLDEYLDACLKLNRLTGKPLYRPIQRFLRLAQVIRSLRSATTERGHQDLKETAYLAAYGAVLGLDRDTNDIVRLAAVPSSGPNIVLESFCESQDIRQSISESLDTLKGCLRYRAREISLLLEEARSLRGTYLTALAQTLAFYVLEYHNENCIGAFDVVSESLKPAGQTEFFCLFKEQALAALPFLLLELIENPRLLQDSADVSTAIPQISPSGIKLAMIKIQQALDLTSDVAGYKKFMQVLLGYMSPCANPARFSASSSHRLVNLAIKMASLHLTSPGSVIPSASTLPKLPPLVNASSTSAPLKPPMETSTSVGVAITTNASDSQPAPVDTDSMRDSLCDPAIARSYRSSLSSAFRSFKGLSILLQQNGSTSNLSVHTTSTGKWSGPMSWRFSVNTGFSSGPSVRDSTATDVTMGGME